jgi:hypothetical protein
MVGWEQRRLGEAASLNRVLEKEKMQYGPG